MIARKWPRVLAAVFCLAALIVPICVLSDVHPLASVGRSGRVEAVWGREGRRDGQLFKPRAVAIDSHDNIYLVDKTARIQVFNADGQYLRGWQTPESQFGRPTGLSFSSDGLLMVADTHYYRVLFYQPDGQLVESRTLGGQRGQGPGQMGWVTDVAQDSRGNYYVSEYGDFDRIQKFDPRGQFILAWGQHGTEPGQFSRPQALVIDADDRLYVADSCNHRIQVFDCRSQPPSWLRTLGSAGTGTGQLRYPYSLVLDGEGHLYIGEFGNHRVQKWTVDGEPLGMWGTMGRGVGELYNPWAIARDGSGRLFVVDTYNNRVYRIRL
jgi:sugar lactone lactonase YvrE